MSVPCPQGAHRKLQPKTREKSHDKHDIESRSHVDGEEMAALGSSNDMIGGKPKNNCKVLLFKLKKENAKKKRCKELEGLIIPGHRIF